MRPVKSYEKPALLPILKEEFEQHEVHLRPVLKIRDEQKLSMIQALHFVDDVRYLAI